LALLIIALAGCGGRNAVPPTEDTGSTDGGAAFASTVLAAFDEADSRASVAGDIAGLQAQETRPALDVSVAAVHRSRAKNRTPPAFRHVDPVFAAGSEDLRCFLVTASLRLIGEELAPTDVSQFVRDPDGAWKLSHNILVTADAVPVVRGLYGVAAQPTGVLVNEARRSVLSAEVFARTTGGTAGDRAVVAPSRVLDQQLAAGWDVYEQQMAAAGVSVGRQLTGAEWSTCAARIGGGVLTFLALYLTDTVSPAPGGPATVTLPVTSPDVQAAGGREPVTGRSVTVSRVEVFLLLVPDNGGATVLGLTDAPTAVRATS
jgi:hypothetical protein